MFYARYDVEGVGMIKRGKRIGGKYDLASNVYLRSVLNYAYPAHLAESTDGDSRCGNSGCLSYGRYY